jgi:hypothetical protein
MNISFNPFWPAPLPDISSADAQRATSAGRPLPTTVETIEPDDPGRNLRESMRNLLLNQNISGPAPAEAARVLAAIGSVELLARRAQTGNADNALIETTNEVLRALVAFAISADQPRTDERHDG